MSQENIELFERANAAMNPGEFSDELAAEFLAPGYRIENVATALSDKTYYGVDGVREWIADTFEGLDANSRYETEEIIADGDDFVVGQGSARRTRRQLGGARNPSLDGGRVV